MKKTLKQWKKEIDEGIARGKADVKAGKVYKLDENFIKDIVREVNIEKKLKNKKIFFNNEKVGILA